MVTLHTDICWEKLTVFVPAVAPSKLLNVMLYIRDYATGNDEFLNKPSPGEFALLFAIQCKNSSIFIYT
jgi:hypothetical protein